MPKLNAQSSTGKTNRSSGTRVLRQPLNAANAALTISETSSNNRTASTVPTNIQ